MERILASELLHCLQLQLEVHGVRVLIIGLQPKRAMSVTASLIDKTIC